MNPRAFVTVALRATAAIGLMTMLGGVAGCGRGDSDRGAAGGAATAASAPAPPAGSVNGVLLITIDTLRADRVGAYGWRAARTPAIDALAARGVRMDHAFASAPITLVSHASLMTGLNPPNHGARHNGIRLPAGVPTLAERLHARGFATGAFIAAFPLDRRFGLDRGFDVYGDTLPRDADGKPRNERPGRMVVDEALDWLAKQQASPSFFLWVHLFEPHAPYESDEQAAASANGARRPAATARAVSDRYDDEVARADAQVARLVSALGPRTASTLIIVTADHGEAFGEHGERGHSLFVYDTTLRVPLVMAGPGVAPAATTGTTDRAPGRVIAEPVALIDVMPTLLDLVKRPASASAAGADDGDDELDGVSLVPLLAGRGGMAPRALYAESFAPLLDFGWSPLRALRQGNEKYIAAPKPELYDVTQDPAEARNLLPARADAARTLAAQVDRVSPADIRPPRLASSVAPSSDANAPKAAADREADARLRSLGYLASSNTPAAAKTSGGARVDPKDRVAFAARISEVTSGELQGTALRAALERLVKEDPRNGQMQMRLGVVLQEAGDCRAAVPHYRAAIAASVPSADPHLGLAECLAAAGDGAAAQRALQEADRIEPGNPIVAANLGMMALQADRTTEAIGHLRAALDRAPDLHAVRFALARAYGRAGQRENAAREARELLTRLPANAPQRAEVERLLAATRE